MKPRKYTNIQVWDGIYCSSTTDYSVDVTYLENGKRTRRTFWVNQNCFDGLGNQFTWETAPKYLLHDVNQALYLMLSAGDYQVYEIDRDGEKRYENLRYHMPNYLLRMVGGRVGVDVPYVPEYEEGE